MNIKLNCLARGTHCIMCNPRRNIKVKAFTVAQILNIPFTLCKKDECFSQNKHTSFYHLMSPRKPVFQI